MVTRRKLLAPTLWLCLLFTYGLHSPVASQTTPTAYTLLPNPAPVRQSFTLSLLGGTWNCSTAFSRESVVVAVKRIDLSYVAETPNYPVNQMNAAATPPTFGPITPPICAYPVTTMDTIGPIIHGNYPTFAMPALAPGKYEVWATQKLRCMVAPVTCKIAVIPQYAGTLEVTSSGVITYSISPEKTAAGKNFTLDLLSYQFNCGTTFDQLSSSVAGNTISLYFLDHATPGAVCPLISKPYGPSYFMKGLIAGTYNVIAYQLPACAANGCLVAPTGISAGNLVVTDTSITKAGWFLKEKKVVLGKDPYPLQILNNKYGNCQTSFSNLNASISSSGIYLSFLIENHPDRICIMDQRPFGPTFQLIPPIKSGAYPVFVTELLACEVTQPYCAVDRIPQPAVDTLYISSTTGINGPRLQSANPSAAFHGNILSLTLPGSSSPINGTNAKPSINVQWKVELLALSGRILYSQNVDIDGMQGGTISLESSKREQRGMYILRLTSPSGQIHSLPVINKD